MVNKLLNTKAGKWEPVLQETKIKVKGTVTANKDQTTKNRVNRRIWVNEVEILPEMGFILRPFYECKFDWGKSAQNGSFITALSVCLAVFPTERLAENFYVRFQEEFVMKFPAGDFELNIDLNRFLKRYKGRSAPDLYSRFCFSAISSSREILLYKDPVSGLITANLAENYALHSGAIPNVKVRKLNERKQKLLFRLFAKGNHIIQGYEFQEIMPRVEDMMNRFYWRSIEKMITKQYSEKFTE